MAKIQIKSERYQYLKLRASRYPIVHWPMGWTFFYFAIAKGAPPVKRFFSSSSFGKESQLSLLSLPSSVHKPTGGHGFLYPIPKLFARLAGF